MKLKHGVFIGAFLQLVFISSILAQELDTLIVSDHQQGQLSVNWTLVDNTNEPDGGYKVSWTGSGVSNHTTLDDQASRGHIISPLKSGTSYVIMVQACLSAGCGGDLSTGLNETANTLPSPVTAVTLAPLSSSSLKASWMFDSDANGISSFNVTLKRTSNQERVFSDIIDSDVKFCDISDTNANPNLIAGEKYTVSVYTVAYDDVSCGLQETSGTYLAAPTNLTKVSATTYSMKFTWVHALDNGESFIAISAGDDGIDSHVVLSLETRFVTLLDPGQVYTVSVETLKDGFTMESCTVQESTTDLARVRQPFPSAACMIFALTKPEAISALRVVAHNSTALVVSWEAPTTPYTSFKVTYTASGGNAQGPITTANTEETLTGLQPNMQYEVSVLTVLELSGLTEESEEATKQGYTFIDTSGRCLTGWGFHGEFCYFHDNNIRTYQDGRAVCNSKLIGISKIASILDAEEQAFIEKMIGRFIYNTWIGLKRDDANHFTWDNGSTLNYSNWAKGQPNLHLPYNCVHLMVSTRKWTIQNCVEKATQLCKAPAMDIDDCASNPCKNDGKCFDGYFSYNCTCVTGYKGINCEKRTNECDSNPCMNNGTCSNELNMYTCGCAAGYVGKQCETDIKSEDVCFEYKLQNTCGDHGSCEAKSTLAYCRCDGSYTGEFCHISQKNYIIHIVWAATIFIIITVAIIVCCYCCIMIRSHSRSETPDGHRPTQHRAAQSHQYSWSNHPAMAMSWPLYKVRNERMSAPD